MIGRTLLEASAFSGRSEKGGLGQTKVRDFKGVADKEKLIYLKNADEGELSPLTKKSSSRYTAASLSPQKGRWCNKI